MPPPNDHPALLEAAHRGVAVAQLSWLRNARASDEADAPLERLFSDEGWELLQDAGRGGMYRAEELAWVSAQLSQLGRARVLLEARPLLSALLSTRAPLGHGAEPISELVTRLVAPADHQYEPAAVLHALDSALAPHARRFLELLARADAAADAHRRTAEKLAPSPQPSAAAQLPGEALAALLERLSQAGGESARAAAAEALARGSAQPSAAGRAAIEADALLRILAHSGSQPSAAGDPDALLKLLAGSQLTAAGDPDALLKLLAGSQLTAASGAPLEPEALARMLAQPSAADGTPTQAGALLKLLAGADQQALLKLVSGQGTQSSASTLPLAGQWLAQTDDAARDLTHWLVKRSAGTATPRFDLPQLMAAVRGREWDGLARPAQRFFRIAAGARGLGFERDMSTRMHGEDGTPLLAPFARSLALAIPDDVRVAQPGLEYGLLSDVAAAQGMGEVLALALVSPALSIAQRRPVGRSVSQMFGGLFAQLRADRAYLLRVEGVDREVAANVGRHVALWILLRSRLAAALSLGAQVPVRSETERLQQLTAASERALGLPLSEGMAVLALLVSAPNGADLSALADGCALHAALRERYDQDYYRNPRVSDVLRGAAARGNALDAAGFLAELGASPELGITRMLELVG